MFLDRIDIDAHGPLHRVELGPFSEHLNVICGPRGAGKTALARFVRDSLVQREYPLGMMSSSSGRVVWADREGLVHCHREKDGTATGRRTVHFDPRGDFSDQYDSLGRSWISGVSGSTDESRSLQSIQIPESIVDGVITDTAVTSVARVVSACVRSGLDDPRHFDGLPLRETSSSEEDLRRRSLRSQLADVEAELARLPATPHSSDQLVTRRNELNAKLAGQHRQSPATAEFNPERRSTRAMELENRMQRLLRRQHELRQSIADLDAEIARQGSNRPRPAASISEADPPVRREVDDLDAQTIRWRRTLAEVHALRDALSRYAGYRDHVHRNGYFPGAVDDVAARRRQLDSLSHSADRHERTAQFDPHHESSHRFMPQEIDQRVDAATRQIDWLLDRYAAGEELAFDWQWTVPTWNYRSGATVAEALRTIRGELSGIRQRTRRPLTAGSFSSQLHRLIAEEIDELCECERWLSASIDQLKRRRESLLRRHDLPRAPSGRTGDSWSLESLQRKRLRRLSDLDRVTLDLNDCRSRAAHLGPESARINQDYAAPATSDWIDRSAIVAELKQIDAMLATSSRASWLRTQRSRLVHELGVAGQPSRTRSPLAEEASRWLVRLSAGRLRRISWPFATFKSASLAHSIHLEGQPSGVCLDGRDESACPPADRALAALAVRMAAGNLLAKRGRSVPLVLETHDDLLQVTAGSSSEYYDWDANGRSNQPVVAAMHDYAREGRQVIVLTSSQEIANQVYRERGRIFRLFADRIVHGHRPIWRPHYEPEHYVGPHPHTYGDQLAPEPRETAPSQHHGYVSSQRPSMTPNHRRRQPIESVEDINRSFDTAWREASGLFSSPQPTAGLPATDWAADGAVMRDGYYSSDAYTTQRPTESTLVDGESGLAQSNRSQKQTPTVRQSSPFFLSVDSPIDQAPSVDAVAAARLRGLKVTHVTHLMQRDPNRLADALGMSNVDAATIRRWQSECRLCCRVPHLRGFDARVLVGCGINDPAKLAAISPNRLLGLVESFLASEPGQRILRTGSSHELSRITTWIATARAGEPAHNRSTAGRGRVVNGRVIGTNNGHDTFNGKRFEREQDQRASVERRSRNGHDDHDQVVGTAADAGFHYGIVSANGSDLAATHRSSVAEVSSGSRVSRTKQSSSKRTGSASGRKARAARGARRRAAAEQNRQSRQQADHGQANGAEGELELRFFLHRESPVVDAPSIGARMAERLSDAGIETVDDLLNADPESLAEQLDHRRADAETIEAWQQQATLVCRIPMLRGHDAQLLVAASYTTPEEVAESDPEEMFALIDPISQSREGQRIIRGGKAPDLAEIKDWIEFARQNRDLVAA